MKILLLSIILSITLFCIGCTPPPVKAARLAVKGYQYYKDQYTDKGEVTEETTVAVVEETEETSVN